MTGIDEAAAGAVLTIDLGAIRANWRLLRERLGGAACAGVVKADAYGLGAGPVAEALWAEGCRTFFVAHVGEGQALRRRLPTAAEIHVLNGLMPGAEGAAADAGLVPVLNSLFQARDWSAEARRIGRRLPATIQVDSGMSRLGMMPAEVEALAAEPALLDAFHLRLAMSHLACADEPDHPANEGQLAAFERLRAMLPPAPASLANSSGIFLGQPWHFDLARPGAALYGINPTPALPNPMRPVVRLDARVIQVRAVPAGTGIGYGHTLVAETPMRLATLSVGYADGWPRRLGAAAWLGDVPLPFAGRVSMDSIILDVPASPEGSPRPGDAVELIGPHRDVDAAARLAGTIGYEILTGLGPRFFRRYVNSE